MNQTRSRRKSVLWVSLILALACVGAVTVSALSGESSSSAGATPGAAVAERLDDAPTSADAGAVSDADAATVTKKTVKERKAIAYTSRTVDDGKLAQGKRKVRKHGVAGVRTLTYEISVKGGKEVSRKLVGDVVTRKPVTEVVAIGTRTAVPSGGGCDPNYTPCVPIAQDVDCEGGSGDGPAYVDGPVRIIGKDVYDLDRDDDKVACDS